MRYHTVKSLAQLLAAIIGCLLCACSNSEGVDGDSALGWNSEDSAYDIRTAENPLTDSTDSQDSVPPIIEYLPLDDSEYPYAGIPRIVIETENHREIKDRETEIPAKLQIWGEKAPESEVMDLTIRGRGNISWTSMPKNSYKIEFIKKQSMLDMPKDRDWALIANYADKTLMKNYLMNHLSTQLGAYYAPRCEFAELYLNKDYQGVYLLTETIKIAKHRVNIPKNDSSYIIEIDGKYRKDEQVVFSDVIQKSYKKNSFKIHEPKNASKNTLLKIEKKIQSFEFFLKNITEKKDNNLDQWIDIDEYIKHYWVQEFSKNPDAVFNTSVYFVWGSDSVLKMGPVWDFDISCGGHHDTTYIHPEGWYVKDTSWNAYVFKDSVTSHARTEFWAKNKKTFVKTIDIIDSVEKILNKSAKNNFKKWDILKNSSFAHHHFSYTTYEDAVNDLKKWLLQRIQWIDSQIDNR